MLAPRKMSAEGRTVYVYMRRNHAAGPGHPAAERV
jgi:hypothetical protein